MDAQLGQAYHSATAKPPPEVIAEDFFVYNIEFTGLARAGLPGSVQTGFIQIEAESDFLIQKLAYFALASTASLVEQGNQVYPSVVVTLTDTGSGREFMDSPLELTSFFGSGVLPYIIPTPKLFVKNSRIKLLVENINTRFGSLQILSVNLHGKKIFTAG